MLNFEKMNQTFNLRMGKVFTVNGDDGASAYEIAVENGFHGTEEEWLESLHGQDGRDGTDGAPGADGKSAYQYAVDGGYKGTEAEFAAKLAQEIPEPYTLPVATAETLGGVMVGKGLRMDGEALGVEPENKYELISEVAYKEGSGVAMITLDTMPDGSPLSCRAVRITGSIDDIDVVKQFSVSYGAYSGTNGVSGSVNTAISSKSCTGAALFEIKYGMMTMEACLWSSAAWVVSNAYWQPRAVYVDDGLITKITIKAPTNEVLDGYAFKIEGVRA